MTEQGSTHQNEYVHTQEQTQQMHDQNHPLITRRNLLTIVTLSAAGTVVDMEHADSGKRKGKKRGNNHKRHNNRNNRNEPHLLTPTVIPEPTPIEPTPEVFESVIFDHGDRTKPNIYLTIDDGWNQIQTERMIEIANDFDIVLTLFPVGEAVRENPTLWRYAHRKGHEIGNHTDTHADMRGLSKEDRRDQLRAQRDSVKMAIDDGSYQQRFYRPPNGNGFYPKNDGKDFDYEGTKRDILVILGEEKLHVALWDIYTYDWDHNQFDQGNDPETLAHMLAEVTDNVQNGSNIVQHTIEPDADIFRDIIQHVQSRGFIPTTMSQGLLQIS
jgi:peptidoglycan/xylan/chitin deacetylase (PgdA/CDA1 family)